MQINIHLNSTRNSEPWICYRVHTCSSLCCTEPCWGSMWGSVWSFCGGKACRDLETEPELPRAELSWLSVCLGSCTLACERTWRQTRANPESHENPSFSCPLSFLLPSPLFLRFEHSFGGGATIVVEFLLSWEKVTCRDLGILIVGLYPMWGISVTYVISDDWTKVKHDRTLWQGIWTEVSLLMVFVVAACLLFMALDLKTLLLWRVHLWS